MIIKNVIVEIISHGGTSCLLGQFPICTVISNRVDDYEGINFKNAPLYYENNNFELKLLLIFILHNAVFL